MKKLTNSQLVYNLTSARNNKTEHPTQEGRDFFAEKEQELMLEIQARGLEHKINKRTPVIWLPRQTNNPSIEDVNAMGGHIVQAFDDFNNADTLAFRLNHETRGSAGFYYAV